MPLDQGSGRVAFVIPALLPDSVPRAATSTVLPVVVYLACYTGAPLLRHSHVELDCLKQRCSLPTGLFEQVNVVVLLVLLFLSTVK